MRFLIGLLLGIVVGGGTAWFAVPGGETPMGSIPEEALRRRCSPAVSPDEE